MLVQEMECIEHLIEIKTEKIVRLIVVIYTKAPHYASPRLYCCKETYKIMQVLLRQGFMNKK